VSKTCSHLECNKLSKWLCIKPGIGKAQATIHAGAQALKTESETH